MSSVWDLYALTVCFAVLALVFCSYFYGLWRVARVREEKDIYLAVYSGFLCHFAVWGVAEGYLITGFWYLMGYSVANVVDVAYWFMAWCLALVPVAVTVVFLVYYFVYGFWRDVRRVASDFALAGGVKDVEAASRVISGLTGDASGFRVLSRTVVSLLAGWGAGNVVQDRVSGALCVLFARWEYKLALWAAYSTFLGDPAGALLKWLLPVFLLNVFFCWYVFAR